MPETSVYTALPTHKSIRLLKLTSGSGHDKLSCCLEVIGDYNYASEYHCLSYCWGETCATNLTDIECNGTNISVTKNLHAALRQIHRNGETQYLWADAISINQADIPERNQQVTIMDEIFRNSQRVYVWLGPGTSKTSSAIAAIERISKLLYQSSNSSSSMAEWMEALSADSQRNEIIRTQTKLQYSDLTREAWQAFQNFMLVPWFERVWVIQEVRQQRNIWMLCGEHVIGWDLVCIASSWSSRVDLDFWGLDWNSTLMPFRQATINVTFMWDTAWSTGSFLEILNASRYFQATDPRDKVFAMLHYGVESSIVINHQYSQKIDGQTDSVPFKRSHYDMQPDYFKSTFEVYREIALQSIVIGQNVNVFVYACQTSHLDTAWSSWIPRWNITCASDVIPLLPSSFMAGGDTQLDWKVGNTPEVLLMRGLPLGTITEVSACADVWPAIPNPSGSQPCFTSTLLDAWRLISINQPKLVLADFAHYILRCLHGRKGKNWVPLMAVAYDQCRRTLGSYQIAAQSTPVTFYHCRRCSGDNYDLCANCYEEQGLRCNDPEHALVKQEIFGLWVGASADCIKVLEIYARDGIAGFERNDLTHGNGYAGFFQTDLGLQGTNSGYAQVGDMVVVFFGSGIPFVLRPHGDGFRLSSGCYVLSYMNGEAIQRWNAGELEAQDFAIE